MSREYSNGIAAGREDSRWMRERIAELEAALKERDWQPIETAPKDGTEVLLTDGNGSAAGYWGPTYFSYDPAWIVWSHRSECEYVDLESEPTHWMPLPEPPKDALDAQESSDG